MPRYDWAKTNGRVVKASFNSTSVLLRKASAREYRREKVGLEACYSPTKLTTIVLINFPKSTWKKSGFLLSCATISARIYTFGYCLSHTAATSCASAFVKAWWARFSGIWLRVIRAGGLWNKSKWCTGEHNRSPQVVHNQICKYQRYGNQQTNRTLFSIVLGEVLEKYEDDLEKDHTVRSYNSARCARRR